MTTDNTRNELTLEVGLEAIRQGKWEHALACFRSAKERLPGDARIYGGMGDAYRGLGQMKRARSHYEKAARLDASEPLYLIQIAELRESAGDTTESAQARLLAGDIYWRMGREDEALVQWQHAGRLQPGAPGIQERLARYYLRLGETEQAVSYYLELAEALQAQNRRMAALHICTTALAMAPDDPRAMAATDKAWRSVASRSPEGSAAVVDVQSGDLVTAANDLAQWQLTAAFRSGTTSRNAQDPQQLERNVPLGQALLHEGRGRAGLAVAGYEQAIAAGLRMPAAFFALGLLYRLLGRQRDAQAALTLAAQDPFYRQAVALLDR